MIGDEQDGRDDMNDEERQACDFVTDVTKCWYQRYKVAESLPSDILATLDNSAAKVVLKERGAR